MKVGIIGAPGTGKTTFFRCLTGIGEEGTTGKTENLGVVAVPDERLWRLSAMYKPKKTIPAEIVFMDMGGTATVERLSAITGVLADADALVVVVGAFADNDPAEQLDSFLLDLTFADLSIVENRLERIQKDRERGHKNSLAELPLVQRLHEHLSAGKRLATMTFTAEEEKALRGYQFVSCKPTLVVANVSEGEMAGEKAEAVRAQATAQGLNSFAICAPLELEIMQLPEEDRTAFLADYGLAEAARERFIREAYTITDLISFFTIGSDEVRAWSIRRGTLAPQAAGKIHSDFEQGFIRAEVVACDDLLALGSMGECRAAGKVRLEGKTYEVREGDVIDFRFSV